MNKIKMLLISFFSLLLNFILHLSSYAQAHALQSQIDAAMGQSFATQSDQFTPIIEALASDSNPQTYWIAYAQFRSSIYLSNIGQNERAQERVIASINSLEAIADKNSEDYALLGQVTSYRSTFEPSKAAVLAGKAESYFQKALKLNKNNMRAHLGLGTTDYYTPVAHGGGTKVQKYVTKAIELEDSTSENGPSWGKNEAYFILASYHQREGDMDQAKMYLMQGLLKFPGDFRLSELKASF